MPTTFRNNLVFANNKRQNIEYRLFATGSAKLKTGSLAIAYSSFYNKFIADLQTVNNSVQPKYYASQSVAAPSSDYLIYQNNRAIYLQNLDVFVLEPPSNINLYLNETSSNTQNLSTKYYASQSVAALSSNYLTYQNDRAIYLQNLDVFIAESLTSLLTNETSSNTQNLSTKYYLSDSEASVGGTNIVYQNNRAIYLQNLDVFITEPNPPIISTSETSSATLSFNTNYFTVAASSDSNQLGYQNNRAVGTENNDTFILETLTFFRSNETGSNELTLNTNYFTVAASSDSNQLGYQNNRAVGTENNDTFILEGLPPIARSNETGSGTLTLNTNYFTVVASFDSNQLGYQNNRAVGTENNDTFILETLTSTRLNETGSSTSTLTTKYSLSETESSINTQIGFQNNRAIYLENDDIFIKETLTSIRLNETGSSTSTLTTKYTLLETTSSLSTQIGFQNNRVIYLENDDILIKETLTSIRLNETGSLTSVFNTDYYMSQSNATGSTIGYENLKYIYLEDDSYLLKD